MFDGHDQADEIHKAVKKREAKRARKGAITKKQTEQFNRMLRILRRISTGYYTVTQMQRGQGEDCGLEYVERLEFSHTNMQEDARDGCKGVREIKEGV